MRRLCLVDDIPDGEARGFPAPAGRFVGLFAVRQGEAVRVYVNACPHIGISLEWADHRFLNAERTLVVCGTHGAEFRIEDGVCIHGPCKGDRLEAVAAEIRDGVVFVPESAGL